MVLMAIYSVTTVSWKEIAFPLCRAMERRWKRNVVSRVSSVIVVIHLPISCMSSMAISINNTERMVRNKKTREVSACIALKVKEASLNLMHH